MFRKKELQQISQLSGEQQKQAYLSLQAGGEVPVHGFRKLAPEKPKGKHPRTRSYTDGLGECGQIIIMQSSQRVIWLQTIQIILLLTFQASKHGVDGLILLWVFWIRMMGVSIIKRFVLCVFFYS